MEETTHLSFSVRKRSSPGRGSGPGPWTPELQDLGTRDEGCCWCQRTGTVPILRLGYPAKLTPGGWGQANISRGSPRQLNSGASLTVPRLRPLQPASWQTRETFLASAGPQMPFPPLTQWLPAPFLPSPQPIASHTFAFVYHGTRRDSCPSSAHGKPSRAAVSALY